VLREGGVAGPRRGPGAGDGARAPAAARGARRRSRRRARADAPRLKPHGAGPRGGRRRRSPRLRAHPAAGVRRRLRAALAGVAVRLPAPPRRPARRRAGRLHRRPHELEALRGGRVGVERGHDREPGREDGAAEHGDPQDPQDADEVFRGPR